jgi:geranylgeranyl reductase family protein
MYDLIVIGSGPAGASAARTAAKSGLKTLLLEKDRIPRNKLCGGGVTPKVLKLLDFRLPDELIECVTFATRMHIGKNDYDFKSNRPLAYMTSRSKLDTFLAEKAVEAGAELRDQSPVHGIEQASSDVEVKTHDGSFRSRILIGADGMGGPTAKAGGFYERWKPQEVAYAIESEVFVGEKAVQDFVGDASYFDLYFGVSPAGYGWVFPKDDHLTVGIGCRLNKLRDARELFYGFVKRVPALGDVEIPKPRAHLIPLGGAAKVPSVRNRMLLAGDCAGFAEPLLGEGIHFSIWGGQIAARVAAEACQEEKYDSKFLSRYERYCRDAFGLDFDVAYKIARTSYLEEYDMDRVACFFFGDRKVQHCLVGLMEGSLRYRDAQKQLAWRYFKYRLAKLGLPFYS